MKEYHKKSVISGNKYLFIGCSGRGGGATLNAAPSNNKFRRHPTYLKGGKFSQDIAINDMKFPDTSTKTFEIKKKRWFLKCAAPKTLIPQTAAWFTCPLAPVLVLGVQVLNTLAFRKRYKNLQCLQSCHGGKRLEHQTKCQYSDIYSLKW